MPYKLFISFILYVISAGLHAETVYYQLGAPSGTGGASTPAGACQLYVPSGTEYVGTSGMNCLGKKQGTNYTYAVLSSYEATACPAGQSRLPNGTCAPTGPQCNTPAGSSVTWTQQRGSSKDPNAATTDPGTSGGPYPSQSPTCGLSEPPDVQNCFSRPNAAGGADFFCTYKGKSTGANATAGAPTAASGSSTSGDKPKNVAPTPADSKGNCPGGTVQGGVDRDGTPICIGQGTNPKGAAGVGSAADARPTTSVTKTTKDASGNTVETTTDTRGNSDGSTTTTTTTTTIGADGSKSSTVNTQTGNNSGGLQGAPDAPESDLCKLHPELNVCRNSSVSGSCAAIACQGDAIQCATLRAAAAMQCAQEQDLAAVKALPSKGLGDAIAGGVDPLKGQIDSTIKGSEVDLSRPTLDQNGFLGGGSCIPDKTFTVMGKSVVVSFARVCNDIQPLRFIVMSCAFILAYMIVSKSVINA